MARTPERGFPDSAVALVLDLLEQPDPVLSAASALDFHDETSRCLLDAGLLKRDGFEATIVLDDEDGGHPIALSWSAERGTFGYHAYGGWIAVPGERIGRLRADLTRILQLLVKPIHRPSRAVMIPVRGDLVWDLGDIRLPSKRQAVSLWFARRLSHVSTYRQLEEALIKSPPPFSRILLTSTPDQARVGSNVSGTTIVAITDLLASGAGLAIDPAVLAKRTGARLPPIHEAAVLEVIGEGRIVRFRGDTFNLKGDKQRAVVQFLYQQYLQGRLEVSAAEIAAEVELGDRTRVRDLFKRNRAWGTLLAESGRVVRFCWPSNEDEVVASE